MSVRSITRLLISTGICLVFVRCGSDRQGDAIGTLKTTEYPETYEVRKSEIFEATKVTGPDSKSAFPEHVATTFEKYSGGNASRLAVYVTDSASSWLGIAHGLKSIGIPFMVTGDINEALRHHVVLVYPIISGALLSPEKLQQLAAFPRNGGTIIGVNVLGALNEVFGFEEPVPSKQHFEIFMRSDSSDLTNEFTDDREQHISIGNKKKFKETIGTYSYSKPILTPLAVYEDKSAAITQRYYETGKAFAIGFDIGYLILKGHNIRHEEFNRSLVNDFEPTIDVLLRFIRNIYLSSERDAVTIQTVPYNKNLSVVLTHNINSEKALDNAFVLADEEKKIGVHSTYFIQTKYIRDMHTFIFKSENDFKKLNQLEKAGMDIASLSVSASPLFDQFEQGTGTEQYPSYRPYVMAYDKTYGGSVYGEMRISKYLIEHYVPSVNVASFRSSYLYTPFTFPQSMLATGYRYSSSVSANASLTHFPFQMNYNREYDNELDAFSFPVTQDDEFPPYTFDRLQTALTLAKKISRYGGCYVGQVHPNAMGIRIEKEFIKALKEDAWFGSLKDFGDWWVGRNLVTVDVNHEGNKRVVILNVPRRMEGLAVMLPIRSTPVSVENGGKYFNDGKLIIFEIAEGTIKITLDN
ncbi:MAG: hypothetical protein NTV09_03300 [Bacteroidetes bacterium]|nr:hypothetical protein [Bacteroidota bacterium]